MNQEVNFIEFKLKLKGYGIVNYDGSQQKDIWNNEIAKKNNGQYLTDNNNKLAKKNLYGTEGSYKVKISSACLRQAIYLDEETPNTMYSNYLLMAKIASPNALLRGYTYLTPVGYSIARKSALTITDAEICNNAVSSIEFFSRSGEKTETSIHTKETIGNTEYYAAGYIDLNAVQFIGAMVNGELNFNVNADHFDLFTKLFNGHIPNFKSKLAYYVRKNTTNLEPIRGAVLSEENIIDVVKQQLRLIRSILINRAGAYAKTTDLECRLVSDIVHATDHPDEGWERVTSDFIDNLTFKPKIVFEEMDEDVANMIFGEVKETKDAMEKVREEKKAEAKRQRDAAKARREAAKAEE